MPLDRFPPQGQTVNIVTERGNCSYRVTCLEATVKVNSLTLAANGDNRFLPIARVKLLSRFVSPYSQSGGSMIADCHPYWVDDCASVWHIWVVNTPGALTLPASSEFSLRNAFEGIPGNRLNVNLDGTTPLVAGDALGPFASIKGIGGNELEIWGRVLSTQETAAEYKIVFGVAVEIGATLSEAAMGKHVTAIP